MKNVGYLVSGVVLVLLAGCSGFGPLTVSRDRFDYTEAISDSWKRQMLFNLVKIRYGDAFRQYLIKNFEPIDFVWRLADEKSIVLMDGGGFDAPNMSVRVSLANLPDSAYEAIGKGISSLLEDYYTAWNSSKK